MTLRSLAIDLLQRSRYLIDHLARTRNAAFHDDLPVPPPYLVYLVSNQFDRASFVENGKVLIEWLTDALAHQGRTIESFKRVLDFGCGCGRVMRHWAKVNGPAFYGADANSRLVEWCRAHLPFATFMVNQDRLPVAPHSFDLIYAISVFTHLTEERQLFWMRALTDALEPGGYLIITVHGTTKHAFIPPDQRGAFDRGALVVVHPELSGKNHCFTFHPEAYVRDVLCRDLDMVAFAPGAAKDADQDVFVLRKPLTPRG